MTSNLTPRYYLVHGGEVLQTIEAISEIRSQLRQDGYTDHESFDFSDIGNGLAAQTQNLSLFATQKSIELKIEAKKLNKKGDEDLYDFLVRLPEGYAILLVADKLKPSNQNSKWFKLVADKGNVIHTKPISSYNWPNWIKKKLQNTHLNPSSELISYFVENYKDNILAATQAIKQLQLIFTDTNQTLSLRDAAPYLHNHAEYNVFDLINASLDANGPQVVRIFDKIHTGGDEILILWGISRELHKLLAMQDAVSQGQSWEQICSTHNIWQQHRSRYRQALQRLSSTYLQKLIDFCSKVDIMIKGAAPGNSWEPLQAICLGLAGLETLTMEDMTVCQNL